jgi:cation diffusion facilitator CzcD-associated flavoprotein CzcO/NAD(P)-dependent dehydrogenase (short-subunit alcohol dehydrogenase family)
MQNNEKRGLPAQVRIAIIGGGFSGLGMAIELLGQGVRDFVVLEKGRQLGGTWRENTYPGCACDVPSLLYSYSYERKSDWSRVFAEQPQIQSYLLDVAERRGVMPFVELGTEVQSSRWDAAANRWRLSTNRGEIEAQFIVIGPGPLHEPRRPELPGIDSFKGTMFHSAEWRHDVDLRGRRVAVLGTGSSAIQFVPKIQPLVEHLFLFQRTAPWVLPKPDLEISKTQQWLFANVPGLQLGLRNAIYGATELLQIAQRHPSVMQRLSALGLWHLKKQVRDPALRAQLTPSFTLGCKRLLLSNTYYPALQAENAELVPHGVREVTETGVIGADGIHREVDTVILGTGFHTTDAKSFGRVYGREGKSVEETWAGSPEAYLGTTCHGFPNAFLMIGPNLGNGHGSAFILIEAQARYIADAIRTTERSRSPSLEVRRSVQRAWNEEVQAALSGTVFNAGGCASWYIDKNGKNSSIYPWTTIDLRRRLSRFDADKFSLESGGARQVKTPPAIDLAGAVVAITGGARGIGLAAARRFADQGAVVCLGDLDLDEANKAAATLGPRGHAYYLDVSKRSSFAAFVDRIEAAHGPIDVLVNNAGVMPTGRFLDEGDEVDRATMGVNHFGTSLGMRLVLPCMIARGRGHVVNVASLAGKLEVPYMATYVASKHATVGLTGAVRQEIEGTGVTLTVVMPGAVKTRLSGGIPLHGISAQEPDDVARGILRSCRTREADVVVPRLFAGAPLLAALVPRKILSKIFATLDPTRLLAEPVRQARDEYERAAREQGSRKALQMEVSP